jgi:hypothetical protein
MDTFNFTNKRFSLSWRHVVGILCVGYVFLTVLFYFFGYLGNPGQRIKGIDSVYYYIYLPSLYFDSDLDFTNELARLYSPGLEQLSDNGLPKNVFSIGPAIFWSPFFLLAHVLTIGSRIFGSGLAPDGFSLLYQLFVYIANSFYGLAGILLTTYILRLYVKPWAGLLAALSILFASQMTYYLWSFTAMSHNTSFASVSLFLLLFLTRGPVKLTALAAALMILARWQNALFLLPVIVLFINKTAISLKLKNTDWKILLRQHLTFGAVLLLGLAPQFFAWWVIYGSVLLIPQGSGFIEFNSFALIWVLFSLHHGLFMWHPLLLVGLGGLYLLWQKQRVLALSLVGIFVLQWIVNAAVEDWWASWSFGHRRFINLLPIFALGLAMIFDKMTHEGIKKMSLIVIFIFGIWNQLFIFQYVHGLIPRGNTVTLKQMFSDKFHLTRLATVKSHIELALYHLSQKDIVQMKHHAKMAINLNPTSLKAHAVYGYACLLSGDGREGYRVFKRWHSLDSEDMLAKVGLAEYLVKRGGRHAASNLFSTAECARAELSICKKIKTIKYSSNDTLLDKTYWDLYLRRLSVLYRG